MWFYFVFMKKIKLSRYGKNKALKLAALVDDEDFEELNQWCWAINKGCNTLYAQRMDHSNGKTIQMHRQILGLTDPKIMCDHRDRNGLNNQKDNLRIATKSQNAQNKKGTGKSKFLGVYLKRGKGYKRDYFAAQIKIKDKNTYIGFFKTEEEAAMAYDKFAIIHHGEFANLNFKTA